MKEKVYMFIIGLLFGAVLATGAFYLFANDSSNCNQNSQMNGGQPPELPSGENGTPPDMPTNSGTQESN